MFLENFGSRAALIDGDQDRIVSYAELKEESKKYLSLFGEQKKLIFLFNQNTLEDLILYISAVSLGHAICLLDGQMNPQFKDKLIEMYSPHFIIDKEIHKSEDSSKGPLLFEGLQLLLSTSGTTGNPKLIRLSRENLLSNAQAIVEYLNIQKEEKAINTLPIHYSYGLSVLHTHLLAGASYVLTQASVAQESFWKIFKKYKCTSLAGVPYTYKIFDRIKLDQMDLPSLKTMTQAGGKLESSLVIKFFEYMQKKGGQFFVMYGQTEATARIAYLPPKFLPQKAEAIGIPIPGGSLTLFDNDREITFPKEKGELVYQGSNVMLGYAHGASDLMKEDEMHGILRTQDLGYFDEDGVFYLTGRLNRISKVYGLRISLDDIENSLRSFGTVAAVSSDTEITIYIENGTEEACEKAIQELATLYKLHPSTFKAVSIPQMPRKSTGKIDYQKL